MQITQQDRELAADAARARTERQYRGTGRYRVTVGGYVVGYVEKVSTDAWIAAVEERPDQHRTLCETFKTRKAAVYALGLTDEAAQTYQEAAFRGAFGTEEQRRAQKAMDAHLAALDGVEPKGQASVVKVVKRDGGMIVEELLEDITPDALKPGDRIVQVDDGEWWGDDGPVVAEAARQIYGDHGPIGVRLLSPPTQVNFLYVDDIDRVSVRRSHN